MTVDIHIDKEYEAPDYNPPKVRKRRSRHSNPIYWRERNKRQWKQKKERLLDPKCVKCGDFLISVRTANREKKLVQGWLYCNGCNRMVEFGKVEEELR
jgi:hypothetical protein